MINNNNIAIKSRLYDYSVTFIQDFAQAIAGIEGNCVYVIDRNVYSLYQQKLAGLEQERIYFIDAIESKKNIDTIMDLIRFWRKLGMRKNWKVICIGGGITQDIVTFASNIFLRNVEWIFFPTTLLSMCDSCIGGKCGINLDDYKNQLGVFYPPKQIYIATEFLGTILDADYINGWGELLKFSLTIDTSFYESIENEKEYIPCPNIDKYIYRGLIVKKNIIEQDEFENDLRRVLNYGHTFGHALEAYTKNAIPHGKAVIWGIDVVNYIAWKANIFSEHDYRRIKALIKRVFIPEEISIAQPEKLFSIISTDKKVKDKTIFLVLPDQISNLLIYPMVLDATFESMFEVYLKETHDYYND